MSDTLQANPLLDTAAIARVDITRRDLSEGHAAAFEMVGATCAKVDLVFKEAMREIAEEVGMLPEDTVGLDMIMCRLRQRVKERGTHPLRRALIHACNMSLQQEEL